MAAHHDLAHILTLRLCRAEGLSAVAHSLRWPERRLCAGPSGWEPLGGESRPPESERGAPGNRRPYRNSHRSRDRGRERLHRVGANRARAAVATKRNAKSLQILLANFNGNRKEPVTFSLDCLVALA